MAVNCDPTERRGLIPEFLRKYRIDLRIFLDEKKKRAGYAVSGFPALFVIDRKGLVAAVPGDFWETPPEKRLPEILPALLEGKPATGRTLLTLDDPRGEFHLLWKRPVDGDAQAIFAAPSLPGNPAEIATLSEGRLFRWSSRGEPLGDFPVPEKSQEVRGADLDGDGRREWIVSSLEGFGIHDSSGKSYWGINYPYGMLSFLDLQDLDGDGALEVLLANRKRIFAYRADRQRLWQLPEIKDLSIVSSDPDGGMLAQIGNRLRSIDAGGRIGRTVLRVPDKRWFVGRLRLPSGAHEDFFWQGQVSINHDLDGDGTNDIVLADDSSLRAFDANLAPIVSLRLGEGVFSMPWSAGNLDGRPGDEIVLFVANYGLVALGRGGEPPARQAEMR